MTENDISNKIIEIAIDVHQSPDPGLLESAFKECLYYRLKKEGFLAVKEKQMPLIYEEVKLECGYRINILDDDKGDIESKSVEALKDVHLAQALTYMKLRGHKPGLLINFNVSLLKNGIRRVVNRI